MSDEDDIPESMVAWADFFGDDKAPIDHEQFEWLGTALRAGATRETAAAAAGIDDLEVVLKGHAKLNRHVAALEARAEVMLLAGMAESRPAFVLERTRPQKYGPTLSRPLEPGQDPDDDLFGGDS